MQHGVFEILQGPRDPGGVMIQAIGAPCQPEAVWHACYPALTLIPNLLISGIVAVIAGLGVLTWAAAFVSHKHGGLILVLLSVAMLLVGGGFVPMFIGVAAGVAGSRIHAPVKWGQAAPHWFARLWPWALLVMGIWLPGSWVLGYFFSQAMLALGGILFLCFDVGLPIVTVLSGFADDPK
jgi:hypothetical protein